MWISEVSLYCVSMTFVVIMVLWCLLSISHSNVSVLGVSKYVNLKFESLHSNFDLICKTGILVWCNVVVR